MSTKIVQPFNLFQKFSLQMFTRFSLFTWFASGLFLQLAVPFFISFSPLSLTQLLDFYAANTLQRRFLRTRSHIKCLVSYLGPFTAPLCSSKTASVLVQTLSGNNRWLLYCLRSFARQEQLPKPTPLCYWRKWHLSVVFQSFTVTKMLPLDHQV